MSSELRGKETLLCPDVSKNMWPWVVSSIHFHCTQPKKAISNEINAKSFPRPPSSPPQEKSTCHLNHQIPIVEFGLIALVFFLSAFSFGFVK